VSGSGGTGGGGGFDPPETDCGALTFTTQLSSPKASVVRGLKEQDVLDLATEVVGRVTVVVALRSGEVAGGLASPLVQRLRECIEAGTEFKAQVLSVDRGQVRVRVRAA